ncbi:hypothetical protein ACVWW6_005728 [Bradyrhizobium sp. USDA 3311]|nr:hypothetical protein [Bradyrhizobium japonicum]
MASKANLVTFDRLLPTGIGLDQARVDGKSFTADQSLLDAAAQDALEIEVNLVAKAPLRSDAEGARSRLIS